MDATQKRQKQYYLRYTGYYRRYYEQNWMYYAFLREMNRDSHRKHLYELNKKRRSSPHFKEYERTKALVYRTRLRDLILKMYGAKCANCGFSDTRALQVDHINGGGAADRKLSHSKRVLTELRDGVREKADYQLLCANCNWIKRLDNSLKLQYRERVYSRRGILMVESQPEIEVIKKLEQV